MTKQSFITFIISGYFIVTRFPVPAVKLDLLIKWALLLNLVISIILLDKPLPSKNSSYREIQKLFTADLGFYTLQVSQMMFVDTWAAPTIIGWTDDERRCATYRTSLVSIDLYYNIRSEESLGSLVNKYTCIMLLNWHNLHGFRT